MQPELVGDPARLALLRRWAVLLDSAFAIPGIPIRFGLDALVGLLPGIGDLATPAFTVLLLGTAVRMRVPAVVLTRMVMNAGLDALIGFSIHRASQREGGVAMQFEGKWSIPPV